MMLNQTLVDGNDEDDSTMRKMQSVDQTVEVPSTDDCCHGHCLCTRHSVTSPCCSVSWKKPFDRVLCGLSSCIVFLLLLGIVAPLIVDSLVYSGVRDAVVIDSVDASSYDVWQSNFYGKDDDSPVINYDVYLFDLQNERDALNGSRPIVSERGPYAFQEYYNKFDISWSDNGETVTYSSQKFFVFNSERTGAGLSLDDQIKMSYPTVVGFQYLLQEIPEETDEMLDYLLGEQIDSKIDGIEEVLQNREEAIIHNPALTDEQKNASLAVLEELEVLLEVVRVNLETYLAAAHPGDTILKLLLCENNPDRVSPFWHTDPVSAYFGWLNDPILIGVQNLLIAINQSDTPWSTAVSREINQQNYCSYS